MLNMPTKTTIFTKKQLDSGENETSYMIMNDYEHAAAKSFLTGDFDRTKKYTAVDEMDLIYKSHNQHSPTLFKIIDEPITNASDNEMRTGEVSSIYIDIEPDTGIVTIWNDGRGIPIIVHKHGSEYKKRETYLPEVLFTIFKSGSNLKTTKDHCLGGVNGLGVKLTGVNSEWLELETVDPKRKLKFSQHYTNLLQTASDAVIEDYEDAPYTSVRFLPLYKKFEYDAVPNERDMQEILDIVRMRVYHLACFLGERTNVYFNRELCEIRSSDDLMKLVQPSSKDVFKLHCSFEEKFMSTSIFVRVGKFVTTSTINGMMVTEGNHIAKIKSAINAKIKELCKEKQDIKTTDVSSCLCIVVKGWLPVANWGTQTKDCLALSKDVLGKLTFDNKIITKIAKQIMDISKILDIKRTIKTNSSKKVTYDKYIPAKKLNRTDSTLLLAEGDSAMQLLIKGLSTGSSCKQVGEYKYSSDNAGIFSLGGVPMNIAKNMLETYDENGDNIEIADEKFYKSEVFGALVNILKLNPDKQYSEVKEVVALPYKRVIICVDQDLDGRGNICSLVLQMFFRLWPNLYTHDYIRHWNSPILRILSKSGKILKEFKYEHEFAEWQQTGALKSDMEVKYFKGLAGHDDKDVPSMFKRFPADTITLDTDDSTKKTFDRYYGKESAPRKKILSTEVIPLSKVEIAEIERTQHVQCKTYLDHDTKEFMLYAMRRTICGLDGMTPVRRKAFTTMLKHRSAKAKKVYQLTGLVASEMLYHHGDMSMNNAIIRMAQKYPGSNYYPLLKGDGQMGSRARKGKDSGSPRYVGVLLNTAVIDVLFPADDIYVLPKKYEDSTEVEPKYYIPVLPTCILEYNKSVTYAWALRSVARSLNEVVNTTLRLIRNKPITDAHRLLPPSSKYYNGEIYHVDNVVYMIGTYRVEGNSLVVTELPLTITPVTYIEQFANHPLVADVRNYSTDMSIEIYIDLKPDGLRTIRQTYSCKDVDDINDPYHVFLKLNHTITENFNFINENGIIEHFDTAYDILYRCFELNRRKYGQKVDRDILITTYKIKREKNIIRFMENNMVLQMYRQDDDVIDGVLSKAEYETINTPALNAHAKYTTEELQVALEKDGTYSYLKHVQFGEVSARNIANRHIKLEELEAHLARLLELAQEEPFSGRSLYEADVVAAYKRLKDYNP
jgi:DNA topoisomerase-2